MNKKNIIIVVCCAMIGIIAYRGYGSTSNGQPQTGGPLVMEPSSTPSPSTPSSSSVEVNAPKPQTGGPLRTVVQPKAAPSNSSPTQPTSPTTPIPVQQPIVQSTAQTHEDLSVPLLELAEQITKLASSIKQTQDEIDKMDVAKLKEKKKELEGQLLGKADFIDQGNTLFKKHRGELHKNIYVKEKSDDMGVQVKDKILKSAAEFIQISLLLHYIEGKLQSK